MLIEIFIITIITMLRFLWSFKFSFLFLSREYNVIKVHSSLSEKVEIQKILCCFFVLRWSTNSFLSLTLFLPQFRPKDRFLKPVSSWPDSVPL